MSAKEKKLVPYFSSSSWFHHLISIKKQSKYDKKKLRFPYENRFGYFISLMIRFVKKSNAYFYALCRQWKKIILPSFKSMFTDVEFKINILSLNFQELIFQSSKY